MTIVTLFCRYKRYLGISCALLTLPGMLVHKSTEISGASLSHRTEETLCQKVKEGIQIRVVAPDLVSVVTNKPAFVTVQILNKTKAPLRFRGQLALRLKKVHGDEREVRQHDYWSPFSFPQFQAAESDIVVDEGKTAAAEFDLSKQKWDRYVSSTLPNRTLFEVVEPGDFILYVTLGVVEEGEKRKVMIIESNELLVRVPRSS